MALESPNHNALIKSQKTDELLYFLIYRKHLFIFG